ncbi:MAG: hypothetical protein Q7R94_02080, partial [bacterium]|nr:hypothetical protein [bacterium]
RREDEAAAREERERREAAGFEDREETEKNEGRPAAAAINKKRSQREREFGGGEEFGGERKFGPRFRPSEDLLQKLEALKDSNGFVDAVWELAKHDPVFHENPENKLEFLKFIHRTLMDIEWKEREYKQQEELERQMFFEGRGGQQAATAPRKRQARVEYPEWYLKQLGKGGTIKLGKLIPEEQYNRIVRVLELSKTEKTEKEVQADLEGYLRNLNKQLLGGKLDDKTRDVVMDIVASENEEEARQTLNKAYLEDENISEEIYRKTKSYLRLKSAVKQIIGSSDRRAELNTALINEIISQEEFLALRSLLEAAKSEKK